MGELDFEDNQTLCDHPIIVLKDKGSCSIRFLNEKVKNKYRKVYKVLVDGGLITENTSRCDHIIYSHDDDISTTKNELVIFIELKGKDLEGAVKQIQSTIDLTQDKFNQYKKKKAFISSTASPRTQFQKDQRKFAQRNKGITLKVCSPKTDNQLWN